MPPWMIQAFLGVLAILDQQRITEEAQAKDEAKFAEGKGILSGGIQTADASTQQFTNRATGGYRNLRERAIGRAEQLGTQQLRDTSQAFVSAQNRALGGLAQRGLGSSTIRAQISRGFTRDRANALAREREATLANVNQIDISTTQDLLNAIMNSGMFGTALQANQTQNLGNAVLGRSDIPDFNPFLAGSQLAASLKPAPKPEEPKNDIFGPLIGGGSLLGASALGSSAAVPALTTLAAKAFVCVSGDAVLMTPDGPVTLADVQVGQHVVNVDGQYREVIDKDYGLPTSKTGDFVRLRQPNGPHTIVVTVDHVVSGRPAGEWPDAEPTDPCPCGDILLDDGSDYIANGFQVATMAQWAAMDRTQMQLS